MKLKVLFLMLFAAITMELAATSPVQASPASTFQRIVVRTGPVVRRGYYRRRPYYHRPFVRRGYYHRGPWRRPYRRY